MKKKIVINGKETKYSVTEEGKIFNDETNRELKGTYSRNEYHSVQLTIDSKPKTFMFHRLVAEAFCDNPNHYTIVDHIDRNKHNNNASNLRWVNSRENSLNVEKKKSIKSKKYIGDFSPENFWEKVFGYEEFYMINKDGIIVNIKTKRILTPQNRNGYSRIWILGSYYSLHILVWESFNHQKVPEGKQIDHIDGDKTNNKLSNLTLVNSSENMKNAYHNGHKGQVAVKQYSLNGDYIKTYNSIREAAIAVGAKEAGLKDATNRYGTCSGYYWVRENDPKTIEQILYDWIPEGYVLINEYPTYCINVKGEVYNKRNKAHCPVKFRTDGEPFIIIKGRRVNIKDLVNEYF